MKEVFNGPHPLAPGPDSVYGVLSLVFWAITIIVSVKYVTLIMRADNHGEGGIMALIALVQGATMRTRQAKFALIALGAFGAALFYGDGMITPAVSVLSAVEGLEIAAPGMDSFVLPVTLAILTALFAIQRFGTGAVGRLFGPVMALWFARARAARAGRGGARARRAARAVAHLRDRVLRRPRRRRVPGAGLRRAGGHRRRGAVRRHGPLRPPPDPARVVPARAPGADAQLLRPGRAAAVRARLGRQPVLPARARTGPRSRWCCWPRWPP